MQALGRSFLLLDVDGTLAPHGSDSPPEGVSEWLRSLSDAGIRCYIVSNAGQRRMQSFCGKLGLPFLANAGKPSPRGVATALERLGARPAETAFLGDQLFTDMACARRSGVLAILTHPIPGREPVQVVLKRMLERVVVRRILDAEQLRLWKSGTSTERSGG